MQEALQHIHHHEHTESHSHEGKPQQEGSNDQVGLAGCWAPWFDQTLFQEHFGKLGVSKRQSPKTKVGGSVGDSSKHKLNSFNQLMNESLSDSVSVIVGTLCVQELLKGLDVCFGVINLVLVGFTVITLNTLKLFVSLWGMLFATAEHETWFATKHHWNHNEDKSIQNLSDCLLSWNVVLIKRLSIYSYFLITQSKEIVNHYSNN